MCCNGVAIQCVRYAIVIISYDNKYHTLDIVFTRIMILFIPSDCPSSGVRAPAGKPPLGNNKHFGRFADRTVRHPFGIIIIIIAVHEYSVHVMLPTHAYYYYKRMLLYRRPNVTRRSAQIYRCLSTVYCVLLLL